MVLLLPGVILCLVAGVLVGPALCTLLIRLGLPLLAVILTLIAGSLSALGLLYGLKATYRTSTLLGVPALYFAEYRMLEQLYNPGDAHAKTIMATILLPCSFILGIILLAYSKRHLGNEAAATKEHRGVRTATLPVFLWFGKKIIRDQGLWLGTFITLGMSIGIVVLGHKLGLMSGTYLGTCGALLAAALVADLRTISRRTLPAEIYTLKGSFSFVKNQAIWGIILCAVATSPILVVAYASFSFWEVTTACALPILLGTACGLFAGTLIAPGPRDITSQCGATLLALALLLLPSVPILNNIRGMDEISLRLGLIALLVLCCLAVEYKRNPSYWRKTHERL
jgi:hypothetical protein